MAKSSVNGTQVKEPEKPVEVAPQPLISEQSPVQDAQPDLLPAVSQSSFPPGFHPADWIATTIVNLGDHAMFHRLLQTVRRKHGKAALLSVGEYLLRFAPHTSQGVLRIWINEQVARCPRE